jgi:neutral ceramidase
MLRVLVLSVLAMLLSIRFAVGQDLHVAGQDLHAGMAESDITPPLGFPMAGYYHERLAEGVHDPLKAKAVVFRQGDQSAAFVVADLTGIARDLCVEVRRRAAAKTGIPERHIVVSATHSHTAPDYTGHLYRYLSSKDLSTSDQVAAYPEKLIRGCVDAIARADASAQPVLVDSGSGHQQTPVAFNRRFVMKDGSVRTWQRLSNPQVVRAAGPTDPEIGLMRLRSGDGKQTIGVVSNFALHLDTVGGKRWSADYPYYVEQSLKNSLGSDVISVFGIGTCGDINHSDPTRTERNKTDFIGNSIAESINAALPLLTTLESPKFQVHTATVELPMAEVSMPELKRAEELIPIARAGGKVDFFELVSAYKAVVLDQLQNKKPRTGSEGMLSWGLSHSWRGIGDSLPVEVVTMTLGRETAIVFLPGEVFVDLGLAIKQASPYRTTLIIELSNCVETMYIPTRAAYAGGSYEVTNSAVQPGSGEMLVEAALTLLRESAATSP